MIILFIVSYVWLYASYTRDHALVHRLISRRHTAVGDFADFQGASDEHT
jgi:hypothetical protein